VEDPNPLAVDNGKTPVEFTNKCIQMNSPCKLLFLNNEESRSQAPFKFFQYLPEQKCCPPMTCKERDVAALSYFRNNFDAGTAESVGSISYCDFSD
jgi:hypothetical protein